MLLKNLRSNNPQSVFLSLMISLPVYGIGMFYTHKYQFQWTESSALFYHVNLISLGWIDQLLGFILVFLSAFLFQHVCDKHNLFPKRSQLPLMLMVLILSVSPQAYSLSSLTVGILLMVSLFDYSFRIQQANRPNDLVFLGSLFVGSLSLIHSMYALFIVLILVAYIYSGKRDVKGLVILVVGFLLPLYFYSGMAYLLDAHIQFPFYYKFHMPIIGTDFILMAFVGAIILTFLSSISSFISALNFNKVVVKNNYVLLIWFGVLGTCVATSVEYGYVQGFSLLSFFIVPVLVNHFLRLKKSWLGNLELIAIILLSIAYSVSQY